MDWKALIIASLAFGLYVLCPRMSAMIVQQAKLKKVSVPAVIVLGTLISIPLFIILVNILVKFGLEWAILFAALGDFAAAVLLGTIDVKAGLELAIITLFVYAGIRLAPAIAEAIVELLA
ncbi:MAG: hypothetical protein B6U95_07490 [Thermofilum sp. ex4484_82]|nr:MAG: hypothetical protein B6U95_07490 [Thermofilum sp. ex4484_82]OYT37090.1 MAG: hypothetical protein B6U96_07485 [Archaeoglobales archaeon ex4484_92]